METPSTSGIPCITLDDEESAMGKMPLGSIRQDSAIAIPAKTSNHVTVKSDTNPIECSKINSVYIFTASNSTRESDKKMLIKNATQVNLLHKSNNKKYIKLKNIIDKLNRTGYQSIRREIYTLLKKNFPSEHKKMLAHVIKKVYITMFSKRQGEWICSGCNKNYKHLSLIAKHLIIVHGWHLEDEFNNHETEMEVETQDERIKIKNEKNAPDSKSGRIQTFAQLPTEDSKIRLFLTIYRAKSFPNSNLELLRELFKNLNCNFSIFNFLTENQNEFKAYVMKTITANFIKYLIIDVGESIFSIFINQYTKENENLLLLVIKYFSKEKNRICTCFYRIIKMESQNYGKKIIHTLNNDGFNIAKCAGFGLDIAYQNEDQLNRTIEDLNNVHSRIVINRCIFQSLLLILEKACTYLPEDLVMRIKKIYKCFGTLQSNEQDFESIILQIEPQFHNLQLFFKSIYFIIKNWEKLKDNANVTNNDFAKNLLHDYNNLIYLSYIWNIIHSVLNLHCSFLKEIFDPLYFFEDLRNILSDLQRQLNLKIEIHLPQLPKEFAAKKYNFIQFLISEIEKLLPEKSAIPETSNSYLLNEVTFFSSKNMKRETQLNVSNIFKMFDLMPSMQLVKNEWNLWLQEDKQLFPEGATEDCWKKINKNCSDYKNISQFILQMLCLPYSNFEVKRIFVIVAEFINKLNDELPIEVAEAFLIIQCQNELDILEICSK